MQIHPETSPEAAIKFAYDFARGLRRSGAIEEDLIDDLYEWVENPYRGNPLLRYLRAGFAAGYRGSVLPWVKEIDLCRAAHIARGWDFVALILGLLRHSLTEYADSSTTLGTGVNTMFRAQVIGPVLAIVAVPAVVLGLYIFSLHNDLAAANSVITLERTARADWQRKYEELKAQDDANAAALAACANAEAQPRETSPTTPSSPRGR